MSGCAGTMPPFPDLMTMMEGGGDMPAMMTAARMNGGGIAKIFDCIIDMTLAKANSMQSDDEEDSGDELPCEYCRRCFSSQMTLKTHILVAHDQDDSVLNLTQLSISKNGRTTKDKSHLSFKQNEDAEVFASGSNCKLSGQNADSGRLSASTNLAAAGVRGMKRGRTESKDLEVVEKGGASGMEGDPQIISSSPQQEMGAFSNTPSDISRCQSGLYSRSNVPMDISEGSRPRSKKTRTKRSNRANPTTMAADNGEAVIPESVGSDDDIKNTDSKVGGEPSADQAVLQRARLSQGHQAAAAAGPADQPAVESPASARRRLRARKACI